MAGLAAAQDPAADRLFREADRLLAAADTEAALDELLLLVRQFPTDRLAPQALLRVVELRRAQGDEVNARSAIQKLLDDYPRTGEAASGFIELAEIQVAGARSKAALEEARATFRRVPLLYGRELYPQLLERARARIRSAEISLLLDDDDGARAELLAAIEDEPPSRWTGRAQLRFAELLLRAGEWRPAAEILQRLHQAPAELVDEGDSRLAGEMLSFIHRLIVRPAAGQRPWLEPARFDVAGMQLREPTGVAAAADGRVMVIDAKLDLAVLVDRDSSRLETTNIRDLVRAGFIGDTPFVVTQTAVELPFDGQRMSFLEPKPGKESPLNGLRAVARGPLGDWFVVAKGWRSLLTFQSRRKGRELLANSRPELVDLAADSRGRVYALDEKGKQVLRLGIDGRAEGVVLRGPSWRRPIAVELDVLDQVYVLDRGLRQVGVYDRDGQLLHRLGPSLGSGIELRNPADLAVDGTGRLYIVDQKLPFVVRLE